MVIHFVDLFYSDLFLFEYYYFAICFFLCVYLLLVLLICLFSTCLIYLFVISLHPFIVRTASESPAPGGGSVAAYVSTLGTCLGVMVANLAAHKPGMTEVIKEDLSEGLRYRGIYYSFTDCREFVVDLRLLTVRMGRQVARILGFGSERTENSQCAGTQSGRGHDCLSEVSSSHGITQRHEGRSGSQVTYCHYSYYFPFLFFLLLFVILCSFRLCLYCVCCFILIHRNEALDKATRYAIEVPKSVMILSLSAMEV
jgi:hypothetical protein